ncbi:hypothetical protein [uncultured Methanobrevibacter sp.]|uniref:hypothetical protein n=1 Tax=uncultured Methanobrevibacter sp. TaxID=253161 RepID=UPI0025F51E14|nr:hypothetical protein [uncultured Methanobrevibacter sp.]
MIDGLYDKTSKILFSTYGDDFLKYFGEYKKIIRELGTEVHTLYGAHRRLDRLALVDDNTLQNWEFEVKDINDDTLSRIWEYNNLKSAEIGAIMDSFIISFANPDSCKETVEIGRSIVFAPIIKYLQKMGLPKELNTIEDKVNDNKKITVHDELTLIFVTLSVKDSSKEKMLKRVCSVLKKIDYIAEYRRVVIDSLISFQIENFVKTKEEQDKLNEVVGMQMSVEELFVQTEREYVFDSGYDQGIKEGVEKGVEKGVKKGKGEREDEIIMNMLENSADDEFILKVTNCSREHLQELKTKYLASK